MGQLALGCHLSLNHQSIKNNKVNGNPHPLLILTPHFLFSLPLNFFYNFSRWRRWWPRAETTSSPTNHTRQTKNTQPNFPPSSNMASKNSNEQALDWGTPLGFLCIHLTLMRTLDVGIMMVRRGIPLTIAWP